MMQKAKQNASSSRRYAPLYYLPALRYCGYGMCSAAQTKKRLAVIAPWDVDDHSPLHVAASNSLLILRLLVNFCPSLSCVGVCVYLQAISVCRRRLP
jgi:hypothetical protein